MSKKESKTTLYNWIHKLYIQKTLFLFLFIQIFIFCISFIFLIFPQKRSVELLTGELTKELQIVTTEIEKNMGDRLAEVSNLTQMYASMTLDALEDEDQAENEESRMAYTSDGVYYSREDSDQGGAAVYYSGIIDVGQEEKDKLGKILTLQPLMREIINTHPMLTSVYFNTYDSLCVIYPYIDVTETFAPKMNIPSYNFYYEADQENNPDREAVWTEAYLDPAGNGWMVSSIAPVYRDDFLEGVVGMDVTLQSLISNVLEIDVPYDGYVILVDNQGKIVAMPSQAEELLQIEEVFDDDNTKTYSGDVFKSEEYDLYNNDYFSDFSDRIADEDEGYATFKAMDMEKIALWKSIPNVGWKLLMIVDKSQVYEQVNSFVNQAIILGILLIFAWLFYALLLRGLGRRQADYMSESVIKPLEAMDQIVEEIENGIYRHEENDFPIKELDDTYNHIVKMGNELQQTNHKLRTTQDELRQREAYLKTILEVAEDMVFELDEDGYLKNIWSEKYHDSIESYINAHSHNFMNILEKNKLREFVEKSSRVLNRSIAESIEYKLKMEDGKDHWFMARLSGINEVSNTIVVSAREVTENKQIEYSLRQAKEEAEEANKAKSKFLSKMSYELRTPMNAVLGFSQLLLMEEDEILNTDQRDSVEAIYKAGNHLLSLIDEILDLAKIETGKVIVCMDNLDVGEILKELELLIRPMAEDKDIVFELGYEQDELHVWADSMRLKQILTNLLINAIKFNRSHGYIQLEIKEDDEWVYFIVADNGQGIPTNELKNIFDPFYRLMKEDLDAEGVGIGLSVSKELVELMGGDINVESTLGIGSRFIVSLRRSTYIDKTQNQENESILEDADSIKGIKRILYIGEDMMNLKLVKHLMKHFMNVKILAAASYASGLEIAKTHKPAMIILDFNLLGNKNYEFIERLKELTYVEEIPIVVMASNVSIVEIQEAREKGADAFIKKPVQVAEFYEKIKKYL